MAMKSRFQISSTGEAANSHRPQGEPSAASHGEMGGGRDIYVYIYIDREREIEREGENERERENDRKREREREREREILSGTM